MNILKRLFKKEPAQYTFCYCDCGNELCKNHEYVKDEDFVTFKCNKCGKISVWDFCMPVPLRMREYE